MSDIEQIRCSWSHGSDEYVRYHDLEWGYPTRDDFQLFEKLCLESFQSGLSWRTILSKRQNFRQAFCQFDFKQISDFSDEHIDGLLQDKGIVRHRGKIEALVNNAKCAQVMVDKDGSLSAFFEPYWLAYDTDEETKQNQAKVLAKELKKRGWKFLGPTTVYAFMQASGLVNDHISDCLAYGSAEKARKRYLQQL